MSSATGYALPGSHRIHPLAEALKRVLAPYASWLSHRVWLRVTRLLLGAMLVPGVRAVTAA
jgi:hypothetical protein